MILSLFVVILIMFLVFVFTAEGVTDSAKSISVGIGVIGFILIFIASIF